MKKTLLLAVLIGFSTIYGFSQTKYGVRAGLNISNMDFKPDATFNNQHRNGFMIGFFGQYDLSKGVKLAPELQFSSEGGKDESIRLDYIQLPVYFKFRLSEKLQIGLGPQAGIKVHEYEDGFRNFAYSGVGGIEFKVSHQLFVDARYTYGLNNILDEVESFEARNTNIQFGFGYKF
ncbi:porin family protein [Seonamhaeicola maritimus]|uniref:Porin family protein n=1 Tax=Seonamhaeicola maritimus TaxID=2591822 RepID=A0A5C7GFJ8_9FLAO|nr:porin family protein [Seonamhaeicola maritimus]TXG35971.1 porin family protein [Seonamhaeicola maritimus]